MERLRRPYMMLCYVQAVYEYRLAIASPSSFSSPIPCLTRNSPLTTQFGSAMSSLANHTQPDRIPLPGALVGSTEIEHILVVVIVATVLICIALMLGAWLIIWSTGSLPRSERGGPDDVILSWKNPDRDLSDSMHSSDGTGTDSADTSDAQNTSLS